jgi:hypothetical protein
MCVISDLVSELTEINFPEKVIVILFEGDIVKRINQSTCDIDVCWAVIRERMVEFSLEKKVPLCDFSDPGMMNTDMAKFITKFHDPKEDIIYKIFRKIEFNEVSGSKWYSFANFISDDFPVESEFMKII